MNDAKNTPATRQYNKRETSNTEMQVGQAPDLDLSLDTEIVHGEGLSNLAQEESAMQKLAFMEEPVEISISADSRSDTPETHVPVQVNGRGAECWFEGRWIPTTWLPVGMMITIKRKYLEVLLRSKTEIIKTEPEGTNVPNPANRHRRINTSNYAVTIHRDSAQGQEWQRLVMAGM